MFGFASSGQVCHPLEDLRVLVPQAPEVNESTLLIYQQGRQAQRGRGIPPRSHIRSNEPPDGHSSPAHLHAPYRCGARLTLETLAGGVRRAVIRKETPALNGARQTWTQALVQRGVPQVPGTGLWARVS